MKKAFERYEEYLKEHIKQVQKAGFLLLPKIIDKLKLTDFEVELFKNNIQKHDQSKFNEDEFVPYALHFYGNAGGDF